MNISAIPQVLSRAPQKESERPNNNQTGELSGPCQDFEAIFLHAIFKGMRSITIDGGLLEKGEDREIFQDFMDMEVAKAAAAQNALGIGEALLRELQDPKK